MFYVNYYQERREEGRIFTSTSNLTFLYSSFHYFFFLMKYCRNILSGLAITLHFLQYILSTDSIMFLPKTRSQTSHSTIQIKANIESCLAPECDIHVFIVRLPHTLPTPTICTPCLTAPPVSLVTSYYSKVWLYHALFIPFYMTYTASFVKISHPWCPHSTTNWGTLVTLKISTHPPRYSPYITSFLKLSPATYFSFLWGCHTTVTKATTL